MSDARKKLVASLIGVALSLVIIVSGLIIKSVQPIQVDRAILFMSDHTNVFEQMNADYVAENVTRGVGGENADAPETITHLIINNQHEYRRVFNGWFNSGWIVNEKEQCFVVFFFTGYPVSDTNGELLFGYNFDAKNDIYVKKGVIHIELKTYKRNKKRSNNFKKETQHVAVFQMTKPNATKAKVNLIWQ